MITDISTFLAAVFGRWQGWASGGGFGGAILLCLYLYERLSSKIIPNRVYVSLVIVAFFFAASFMAWRDQYHAYQGASAATEAVQAKLNALSKPILAGNIVPMAGAYSGEKQENTLLTLAVHISNSGAPTGIESPSLEVAKDGKTLRTDLLPPADGDLYAGSTNTGPRIPLRIGSHLFERAMRNPIPTNVAIDTWLQAVVYGLTKTEFGTQGTNISLSFVDVATGTRHTLSTVTTGARAVMPDLDKLRRETRP